MDTPEARRKLEALFPRLADTGYEITSDQKPDYNCIAYAAGVDTVNWEPTIRDFAHAWPNTGDQDQSIDNLIRAYATIGYAPCDDGSLEAGIEKIAIYGRARGEYTHAAIQRENGSWASKIGALQDIEHVALEGLDRPDYGEVKCFLARPRQ
jgi:hypothetical protein